MNLTSQPVYQKSTSSGKPPTKKQLERWARIRLLGCSVNACRRKDIEIHHCETGRGGRKDHDKVAPLCNWHHTGESGIHKLGRHLWQSIFGTEQYHMDKTALLLGEKLHATA